MRCLSHRMVLLSRSYRMQYSIFTPKPTNTFPATHSRSVETPPAKARATTESSGMQSQLQSIMQSCGHTKHTKAVKSILLALFGASRRHSPCKNSLTEAKISKSLSDCSSEMWGMGVFAKCRDLCQRIVR